MTWLPSWDSQTPTSCRLQTGQKYLRPGSGFHHSQRPAERNMRIWLYRNRLPTPDVSQAIELFQGDRASLASAHPKGSGTFLVAAPPHVLPVWLLNLAAKRRTERTRDSWLREVTQNKYTLWYFWIACTLKWKLPQTLPVNKHTPWTFDMPPFLIQTIVNNIRYSSLQLDICCFTAQLEFYLIIINYCIFLLIISYIYVPGNLGIQAICDCCVQLDCL